MKTNHETIIPKPDYSIPTAFLGSGYSSDRLMPVKGTCLKDGEIYYGGGSKSTVEMSNSVEFEEITNELNNYEADNFNIGIYSTSISTDYAKYIKSTDYSLSFYFLEKVDLPSQIFQPSGYGIDALRKFGKDVYNIGLDLFREKCGDKFHQEATLGGRLFATLKLQFHSVFDKAVFTQYSSSSFLGIEVASETIQKIAVQYGLTGTLELSAMQIGGKVGHLAKIFQSPEVGYYISKCSMQDISSCNAIISRIVNYAANDFADQMDVIANGTVIGGSPLKYILSDYTDLGLNATSSIVTDEILEARGNLTQIYQDNNAAYAQTEHFLNLPNIDHIIWRGHATYWQNSEVDPVIMGNIKSNNDHSDHNLNLIMNPDPSQAAIGCYFYPTKCLDIYKNIITNLKPLEPDVLAPLQHAYLYFAPVMQSRGVNGILFLPVGDEKFISDALVHSTINQDDTGHLFVIKESSFCQNPLLIGTKSQEVYNIPGGFGYYINPQPDLEACINYLASQVGDTVIHKINPNFDPIVTTTFVIGCPSNNCIIEMIDNPLF
jgi:hypothetical protein